MSKLLARLLGLANPQMREFVELMYEYTEPQIVDSSLFEQTFGLSATPLDEALCTTGAGLRVTRRVALPYSLQRFVLHVCKHRVFLYNTRYT